MRTSYLMMSVLTLAILPVAAQEKSNPPMTFRHAENFAITPPLRELIANQPPKNNYGLHQANPVRTVNFHPGGQLKPAVDPVEQSSPGGPSSINLGLNLLGVGNGFPNYTVPDAPPDTNAAVGDTEVVEWVNVSYALFDKTTGAILAGPIEGSTLWSSLGGNCAQQNGGDIIAQWDKTNHRWLLAQNTFDGSPYDACLAVSQTDDALGSYYVYSFSLGGYLPDYPKYGVWPTGYFETMNSFLGGFRFEGAQVCAYNSAKLIVGDQSAEQICFQLTNTDYSLLPADQDSTLAPPTTQDEFFIGSYDVDNENDHLYLYSMHPDYASPSQSTFVGSGLADPFTVPTYTPFPCGNETHGPCIPEPPVSGVASGLAAVGDRLMYRFAYWNDGPLPSVTATPPLPANAQHWFVNHVVAASGGQAGVRWYEITSSTRPVTINNLTLYQSGTFAPDSNYRWMGSLTRDKAGDIALGYSLSSQSVYPSIAVTGRVKSDPLGTMEAEQIIVNGTGSQSDTYYRWGDYSSMAIDAADGCTFWYAQEFYLVTATYDWSTQVASLKFSNCQ
jgi:hypothetical protein